MRNFIKSTAIDALKICVTGGKENNLFNYLTKEDGYFFDGGSVKVNERITNTSGDTKEIFCRVLIDGLDYQFAEIQLSNDKYSFITICNRSFYDYLTTSFGKNANDYDRIPMSALVGELLPQLDLMLLHVTRVDVALDVNVSALSRLKKAIKNTKELVMIVNGKRVSDEAASLGYFYQANRYRLLGQPTLYLKSTGGVALKVYDKGRELAQASNFKNDYIRKWTGINGATMHRVELTLKANKIAKFCQENNLTQEEFLEGLLHNKFRMYLLELSNDVLRFNPIEKANNKKCDTVSVLDVVLGRYSQ